MFEFEHRIFADTNGQREVVRQPKSIDEMLCHDIAKEKVTEIFCIIDEFDKNLDVEMRKKSRRRVKWVTAKNTGTRKEGSPGAR